MAIIRRAQLVLVLVLAMVALAAPIAPKAHAQASVDWYGWGLHVNITNGAPQVLFISYLGSNLPRPRVLADYTEDISSRCTTHGKLTYSADGDSAIFDGSSYISCDVPAWGQKLAQWNPALDPAQATVCSCALGGPFWVDAEVNISGQLGTLPIFDASELGVEMNLLSKGTNARTEVVLARDLGISSTSYSSQSWPVSTTADRVVMGTSGPQLVAVADHFSWLSNLVDPNWRKFFKTQVGSNTFGHWHESPSSWSTGTADRYELGTGASTVYIGYNTASDTYFKGTFDEGGIEPGCKGT